MPKILTKFKPIPHLNDPEIGFNALKRYVTIFARQHYGELRAIDVEVDEFIDDTITNMCRRDGYPQYDANKNRGNFQNYVNINCRRNQMDWAKKHKTYLKNLAIAQGVDPATIDKKQTINCKRTTSLDMTVPIAHGRDVCLHEFIKGSSLSGYTEKQAKEEIYGLMPTMIISEAVPVSWRKITEMMGAGWTNAELARKFGCHSNTIAVIRKEIKEYILARRNNKDEYLTYRQS